MANVQDYINQATSREEIRKLLHAIGGQESTYDPSAMNKDSGATGMFQIMPETARGLGFKGSDAQLRNPAENAKWAAKYLEQKFDKYGGNIFDTIASYYQGDNRRGAHGGYEAPRKTWASGVTYPSTDEYVQQVADRLGLKYTFAGAGYPTSVSGEPMEFKAADRDAIAQSANADVDKFQEWINQQKLSPEVIALFEKALQDTDKSTGPAPRPVPQRTSLGGRFLSAFSGGLASNISGNPQYFGNAIGQVAQKDQEAASVEAANRASEDEFRMAKEKRRRGLMDTLFDYHVKDLIKKGDVGTALKTMIQEEAIKGKFKSADIEEQSSRDRAKSAASLEKALAVASAQGEERRKTLERRASLLQEQEGLTKDEAIELQSDLDGIEDDYKEQLKQMSPMEGGEGIDEETLLKLMAAKRKMKQRVLQEFRDRVAARKAGTTQAPPPAYVNPAPTDSTQTPAPVDSLQPTATPQTKAAAPLTPSERVRAHIEATRRAKAAASGG